MVVLSAALLALPAGPALAAPPAVYPSAQSPDERGLLGSVADRVVGVADRSTELMGEVRDRANGLVDAAINFLGVRYKRGGSTAESGFDCSGFTRYVFENSIGRVLPHRADEQANSPDLVKVEQKDLKPGDLVFFDTMRRTFSHVGIYLGDGKFIHSPRTGETVRIEDLNVSYWARRFTGGRRVPELADAGGNPSAAGTSMLASLTSRLPGFGGSGGAGGAPVVVPAIVSNAPATRLVGTPPALPSAAPTTLGPSHDPFARALNDR